MAYLSSLRYTFANIRESTFCNFMPWIVFFIHGFVPEFISYFLPLNKTQIMLTIVFQLPTTKKSVSVIKIHTTLPYQPRFTTNRPKNAWKISKNRAESGVGTVRCRGTRGHRGQIGRVSFQMFFRSNGRERKKERTPCEILRSNRRADLFRVRYHESVSGSSFSDRRTNCGEPSARESS